MATEDFKPEDLNPDFESIGIDFALWQGRFLAALDPNPEKLTEALNERWPGETLLEKAKAAAKELEDWNYRLLGKKSLLASLKKKIGLFQPGYRAVVNQRIQGQETLIAVPLRQAIDRFENLIRERV